MSDLEMRVSTERLSLSRFALVVAVLFGLLAGGPTPAAAQSSGASQKKLEELPPEQKEKFVEFIKAGKEAYSAGNFEKAIPFFEQAYDIVPNPDLHYRIALCHERSGQPSQALEHYKTFLELKPDTEKRGAVEKTIKRLEKQVEEASVASVSIKSDPTDAEVTIRKASADKSEAEARGSTPLDLEVKPGKIAITLSKDGYQSTEEVVEVRAGETHNFSYTLPEASGTDTGGEQPKGSASSGGSLPVGALTVGGIGTLVSGGLFGVGWHCKNNPDQCSRALYNVSAIGAYTGAAVGAVGFGLATYRLVTGGSQGSSGARADRGLELNVRFTGTGLQLNGRF